jgi:nucleoside-diphosphate-sugar epimerase
VAALHSCRPRYGRNDVVDLVSSICGPVAVVRQLPKAGDVPHTGADTCVAASAFGYRPRITVGEGLRAIVDWERSRQAVPA